MLESILTLEHEGLSYNIIGTRHEISGKIKETLNIELKGQPLLSITTEELDLPNIRFPKDVYVFIKAANKLLPEDVKTSHSFLRRWAILITRLRNTLNKKFKPLFYTYVNKLKFSYELNSDIHIKNDKVQIELYNPTNNIGKVSLVLIKLGNRRYKTDCTFTIMYDSHNKRVLTYSREDVVASPDILNKQLLSWLDRIDQTSPTPIPRQRFSDIRSGVSSKLKSMELDIERLLDRFNKGYEI